MRFGLCSKLYKRPGQLLLLIWLLGLNAARPAAAQLPIPTPVPTDAPSTAPTPRPSDDPNGPIRVDYKADKVEYLKPEGLYRLSGHVDLHVRDVEIKTEELDYEINNKILRSRVPFEMIQTPKDGSGPRTLKGKSFVYNVDLRRIEALDVYLVIPAKMPGQEVYIQGDSMTAYNDGQRVVMHNGFFTTCNHFAGQIPTGEGEEDPYSRKAVRRRATHYAVEGETMDFIDNDRLLVWNAQVLTFENPAFWFPFWYVPLSGAPSLTKPDLDAGQNPTEGIYAKFKGYYKWNEYHDGNWYLSLMEKKGVGLGFKHDWIAFPNSITSLYFYGIPLTKDLINLPGSIFTLPTPGDTSQLQIQQTRPEASWLDGVGQWLSNKFQDHDFSLEHHQLILPHLEATLKLTDRDFYNINSGVNGLAARTPQRGFNLNLNDTEIFNVDPYSDLTLNTTLGMIQTLNESIQQTIQPDRTSFNQTNTQSQTQNRTATIQAQLGQTSVNVNSNWSNNFSQTLTSNFPIIGTTASASPAPSADPAATPAPTLTTTQAPTVTENWTNTLALTSKIDEKTDLSVNLNLNNSSTSGGATNLFTQTLTPTMTLRQAQDWGSVELGYNDFLDLSPSQSANNSGQLKKIPEIKLNFNPLFQTTFPIQFATTIGRYLEPGKGLLGLKDLGEIGRSNFSLNVGSKEFDLGLGNKVDFSGTGYEQSFYQTLDAQYKMTGAVRYRNDLTKYFIPSLTYTRNIVDPENHSPFTFDSFAVSENNLLSYDFSFVNLPEFTMKLTGGYDFQSRAYSPANLTMNSEIGSRFAMRFGTSYSFAPIRDADIGQLLKDNKGNVYRHGDPITGQTFTVRPEDVGSLNPYGGTWGTSSFGVHWRSTDYDIVPNNLNTFGLDSGIPEGLDLGGSINFDFDQGRLDNITGQLKWIFGSSWQWHTELELTLVARPSTVVAGTATTGPTNWAALEIPFNITVRKDLHDFILSASWDSFLQQFSLNLQLLAFPDITTSKILSNVNSLGQQLNTLNPTGLR